MSSALALQSCLFLNAHQGRNDACFCKFDRAGHNFDQLTSYPYPWCLRPWRRSFRVYGFQPFGCVLSWSSEAEGVTVADADLSDAEKPGRQACLPLLAARVAARPRSFNAHGRADTACVTSTPAPKSGFSAQTRSYGLADMAYANRGT